MAATSWFGEILDWEALRELGVVVAIVALDVRRGLVVDDAVGLRRDRVEVLRERRAVHRREEVIREDEPVRVGPVARQCGSRVLRVSDHVLAERDAVVAVHLAAVDRVQPGRERMAEIVRKDRWCFRQGYGRTVFERAGAAVRDRAAFAGALGTRIRPEVVVERPVLLHQEDHVLDRSVTIHRIRAISTRSGSPPARGAVVPCRLMARTATPVPQSARQRGLRRSVGADARGCGGLV